MRKMGNGKPISRPASQPIYFYPSTHACACVRPYPSPPSLARNVTIFTENPFPLYSMGNMVLWHTVNVIPGHDAHTGLFVLPAPPFAYIQSFWITLSALARFSFSCSLHPVSSALYSYLFSRWIWNLFPVDFIFFFIPSFFCIHLL